jgi:hypothetical protein
MADLGKRPLGLGQSAVAGALTGFALVAIVWGAAWVLPPPEPEQDGSAAVVASEDPKPTATVTVSGTPPAVAKREPDKPKTPSPGPTATPSATPPVPVRATVSYQVEAKGAVKGDVEEFAAEVAEILADPLGWPAAGVAFKRVETGGQITVWLAEPAAVPSFSGICSSNLSCSIDRNIIVNETRWQEGALPGVMDETPIAEYRKMVVNHEVGHWLGHHAHSPCPGEGLLAPLMMQQSKGLDGCLFNPYPLPGELRAPDLLP